MKILLVEDNESIRSSLSEFLTSIGHIIIQNENGEEALKTLSQEKLDLVLSDIKMPIMDGYNLLKEIKSQKELAHIEVLLFTGHGDIKKAVQAMRDGAYDYLLKPIDVRELAEIINRLEEFNKLKSENIKLSKDLKKLEKSNKRTQDELKTIRQAYLREVGTAQIGIFSKALISVFDTAKRLHKNPQIPVFIEGETGTGKELVARYIHFGDGDITTPFIGVNCAAITSNLFESELFGYEAGSFTGGNPKGQKGKIEIAATGTIFLDEITEMPIEHQAKLLRILQENEFFRVGGLKKIKSTARFVCSTNRDVKQQVQEGTFREDLYFRLSVGYIRIPPLRERKEEIIPLALMFLEKLYSEKKTQFYSISQQAQNTFKEYNWPGNVRELKNAIERITLLWDDEIITEHHINAVLMGINKKSGNSEENLTLGPDSYRLPEEGINIVDLTLSIVKSAYEKFEKNQTKTAQYLGISVRTLHTYLKKII